MTLFATKRCPVCHKTGSLMVDEQQLFTYLRGEYVARAFPGIGAPLREQIISGTHPDCWKQMFGEDEVLDNQEDYSDVTE